MLQCFFLIFFFLSRAQNRPGRRFSLPPRSFKTDVNGPGWAALPASLLSSHIQNRYSTSDRLFKRKPLHWWVTPGILLWRSPRGRVTVFLGALTHHLHPLEQQTQRHQQQWQWHRTEEAAHRDTPRSGWRRQFHTVYEGDGPSLLGVLCNNTPLFCTGGHSWQTHKHSDCRYGADLKENLDELSTKRKRRSARKRSKLHSTKHTRRSVQLCGCEAWPQLPPVMIPKMTAYVVMNLII